MKYYVYAYIRTDGTPYYIGKGTGKRAWNKSKGEIQKPSTNTRIVTLLLIGSTNIISEKTQVNQELNSRLLIQFRAA